MIYQRERRSQLHPVNQGNFCCRALGRKSLPHMTANMGTAENGDPWSVVHSRHSVKKLGPLLRVLDQLSPSQFQWGTHRLFKLNPLPPPLSSPPPAPPVRLPTQVTDTVILLGALLESWLTSAALICKWTPSQVQFAFQPSHLSFPVDMHCFGSWTQCLMLPLCLSPIIHVSARGIFPNGTSDYLAPLNKSFNGLSPLSGQRSNSLAWHSQFSHHQHFQHVQTHAHHLLQPY